MFAGLEGTQSLAKGHQVAVVGRDDVAIGVLDLHGHGGQDHAGGEPACLIFQEGNRPVRTASVTQVRQPIYQRSVSRWKNYERSLGPLLAKLSGERIDASPSSRLGTN